MIKNLQSNVFLQVCCGHIRRKLEHFLVLIHFRIPTNKGYRKRQNVYLKRSLYAIFNQRTDSPKGLLACKVLMECCVSSMQLNTCKEDR